MGACTRQFSSVLILIYTFLRTFADFILILKILQWKCDLSPKYLFPLSSIYWTPLICTHQFKLITRALYSITKHAKFRSYLFLRFVSSKMTFVRFGGWKIPRPNRLFGIFHGLTWQNFLSRAFKPLLALWQVCVCSLHSLHKLQCFAWASPQQHWCFLPSLRLGKKPAIRPRAFVKP